MHGAMLVMCYKARIIIFSIWYGYSQKQNKTKTQKKPKTEKKTLLLFIDFIFLSPAVDIEVLEPGTWCCLIINPPLYTAWREHWTASQDICKFDIMVMSLVPRACVMSLCDI